MPERCWERIDETDGTVRFEIRVPRDGLRIAMTAAGLVLPALFLLALVVGGVLNLLAIGSGSGACATLFGVAAVAALLVPYLRGGLRVLAWRRGGRETLVVGRDTVSLRRWCAGGGGRIVWDERGEIRTGGVGSVELDADRDPVLLQLRRGLSLFPGIPEPTWGRVRISNGVLQVGAGLSIPEGDAKALRDALDGLHGLRREPA